MEILHLTLYRHWFDEIAAGRKPDEYRDIKPYWTSRLIDKNGLFRKFDEVHFTNGFGPARPFMRCRFRGTVHDVFQGRQVYAIRLGEVLEIRNYQEVN